MELENKKAQTWKTNQAHFRGVHVSFRWESFHMLRQLGKNGNSYITDWLNMHKKIPLYLYTFWSACLAQDCRFSSFFFFCLRTNVPCKFNIFVWKPFCAQRLYTKSYFTVEAETKTVYWQLFKLKTIKHICSKNQVLSPQEAWLSAAC